MTVLKPSNQAVVPKIQLIKIGSKLKFEPNFRGLQRDFGASRPSSFDSLANFWTEWRAMMF